MNVTLCTEMLVVHFAMPEECPKCYLKCDSEVTECGSSDECCF